jgi:hypothetical protein
MPSRSGGPCTLELAAGGAHLFVVGRGFAADSDVVLNLDRPNGDHLVLDISSIGSLHTDTEGRFGVELTPFPEDVGRGLITASAGCAASLELVVTADQIQQQCIDLASTQALMDGTAYRSALEADEPVHWWHFDEQAGNAAADSIGGAQGQWQGNLTPVAGDGGTGAMFFSGDGASYIGLPRLTFDDFTVEAWVLVCDFADNQDVLVGNGSEPPDINFFEARPRLFVGDESGDVVTANTFVVVGTWEHWAIARDAAGTRIFHNGVLDATGASWDGTMVVTMIGRGTGGSLRGVIDELAIYDRALTEEELAAHIGAQ